MRNNFKKFKKVPLVTSLVFVVLSFSIFVFIYNRIQNDNNKFNQMAAKWQAETSKAQEIRSLNNALKAIEPEKKELDSHFIQSSDVVPFLDTVEKLAPQVGATANVTLVNVSADNTSLTVGVSADGTFESLHRYLTLLENSPYQLKFNSVAFTNNTRADTANSNLSSNWSATFKIQLLSFMQ